MWLIFGSIIMQQKKMTKRYQQFGWKCQKPTEKTDWYVDSTENGITRVIHTYILALPAGGIKGFENRAILDV